MSIAGKKRESSEKSLPAGQPGASRAEGRVASRQSSRARREGEESVSSTCEVTARQDAAAIEKRGMLKIERRQIKGVEGGDEKEEEEEEMKDLKDRWKLLQHSSTDRESGQCQTGNSKEQRGKGRKDV